jgi:peptide/nickel transport system permease protein
VHGRRGALVRFLTRRLLSAALVVFIVASGTLVLSAAADGDYFSIALGFGPSQRTAASARAALGFDQPVSAIYLAWLARAARLDFGISLTLQRPVGPLVAERAARTAVLGVAALAIVVLLGVPLGMLTGSRPGPAATIVRAASSVCLSVPPLVAAILLVAVAAFTGILPAGGMTTLSMQHSGWPEWIRDVAWHVPLPALALALPFVAMLERVQSQAIAQALSEPSMIAAMARGLSYRRMLWRHAWRLGAKPVAALAGLIAGTLLSGSFAVELVTSWPGLGRLTYDALMNRDIYLAAGCAAAAAVFLECGIVLSDVLLAIVDPRIAAAGTAAFEEVRT